MADQLGHDLGVGLGREAVALGGQLGAQVLEVLDDAVVHDRDPAGLVRMGVVLGRRAMGRPAGVADAGHAGERLGLERALEIGELALGAAAVDPAPDQGRDAGAVVAAVLEPPERIEQQRRGRLAAEDTDDAAHGSGAPVNRASSPASLRPGGLRAADGGRAAADFVGDVVWRPRAMPSAPAGTSR